GGQPWRYPESGAQRRGARTQLAEAASRVDLDRERSLLDGERLGNGELPRKNVEGGLRRVLADAATRFDPLAQRRLRRFARGARERDAQTARGAPERVAGRPR